MITPNGIRLGNWIIYAQCCLPKVKRIIHQFHLESRNISFVSTLDVILSSSKCDCISSDFGSGTTMTMSRYMTATAPVLAYCTLTILTGGLVTSLARETHCLFLFKRPTSHGIPVSGSNTTQLKVSLEDDEVMW